MYAKMLSNLRSSAEYEIWCRGCWRRITCEECVCVWRGEKMVITGETWDVRVRVGRSMCLVNEGLHVYFIKEADIPYLSFHICDYQRPDVYGQVNYFVLNPFPYLRNKLEEEGRKHILHDLEWRGAVLYCYVQRACPQLLEWVAFLEFGPQS